MSYDSDMTSDEYWVPGGRRDRNERSRVTADHLNEAWSQDELELLMTWDRSEEELTVAAEILGRTREACRVKYYLVLRGPGVSTASRTVTTTVTYTYQNWDPEDRSPWYA